ncbi:MAG: sulfate adenylyltransferase, partial [Microcystis panniformis]
MTVLTEGIAPHGGQLINRIATAAEKAEFLALAEKLPRVSLDERSLSDLVMIAIGGFSPLKGFMEQDDYEKVVDDMRLINGLPWAIPVTLSVSEEVADPLKEGNWIRLDDSEGNFVGVLELTQKYRYNKAHEAVNVYRTDDQKHPGVKVLYEQGEINLAGPIWLLQRDPHPQFPKYQIDPLQSRQMFHEKAWKTIVGF